MRMKTVLSWAFCLALTLPIPGMSQSAQPTSDMRLTSNDLQNLGRFIADLARSLRVSMISVCVHPSFGVEEAYRKVALVLAHSLVFPTPCADGTPPAPTFSCSHRSGIGLSAGRSPCWNRQLAMVHLTSREHLEETVSQMVDQYGLIGGSVPQVVVGQDLTPANKGVSSVASWLVASYTKATKEVVVQEVFSFSDSNESVVQPIGSWRPTTGLLLHHTPGQGPLDFHGHTITLASFPYPPYVMLGENCSRHAYGLTIDDHYHYNPRCLTQRPQRQLNEEVYVGYLLDIFNILARKLNFTYRVLLPDHRRDYIFGMGATDNHSGLVGMVFRQEAEVALASLSISKDRLMDIDFSGYVEYFFRNLYIRSNATLSNIGWGTYVQSFQPHTWVGTAALLAAATLTLWFINQHEKNLVPWDILTFFNILFMFFSCVVQQGVPTMPATYRGRAVFWLFWFSCVILYASYTARLTSSLTVSTKILPFSSFASAVASYPTWQIGIMRGTPLLQFLKEAKGRSYDLVSSRLDDNPDLMVDSEEEGVARLLTANYAFLAETQLMSYMFKENCSIKEISVKLFPSYGHLGYAKNLPFAGVFDIELFRLVSGGVMDRLRRRWWGVTIPCEEPMPFTELDFTHTVTAFLVLLTGIILAIVFFVMEKICKKISLKKHKSFCISQLKVRSRQALMTLKYNVNTADDAASSSAHVGRFIAVDPTGRSLEYETRAQANVSHKPNSSISKRKTAVPDR